VKEIPNDTLYCLNEHDELIPKFVFNLGNHTYDKEKRANSSAMEGLNGVILIAGYYRFMVGASNYIFFNADLPTVNIPLPKGRASSREIPQGAVRLGSFYPDNPTAIPLGIYNIINETTQLLDTDPFSRLTGLINDLDGGLSFWPIYCNLENELVDIYQAYKMKEYLTEDYFIAHEIKNAQAHQKLRELLKTLKDDDNPVVVIAKLK